MTRITLSTKPHDEMEPIISQGTRTDLIEQGDHGEHPSNRRKLGRGIDDKPGADLDREDAKILRLLAAGYSPQCLVVEHGIEMSDIRRVCAAAGAR
jgi:hypothetical protein